MKNLLVSTFLFWSLGALGEHASQPQRESEDDLRHGKVLFKVTKLQDQSLYWLERTATLDYFLKMKHEDDERMLKLSSREAVSMDREFARHYLTSEYQLPPNSADCKVMLRVNMKGEEQDICEKDDKKTQEWAPFLKNLQSKF